MRKILFLSIALFVGHIASSNACMQKPVDEVAEIAKLQVLVAPALYIDKEQITSITTADFVEKRMQLPKSPPKLVDGGLTLNVADCPKQLYTEAVFNVTYVKPVKCYGPKVGGCDEIPSERTCNAMLLVKSHSDPGSYYRGGYIRNIEIKSYYSLCNL